MSEATPEAFYRARPWTRAYGDAVPAEFRPLPRLSSVGDIARDAAARFGAAPAHTVCLETGLHATLDFRTVDAEADALAAWLRHDAGVASGDRVAVQMPNCLAYPIAVFGILRAGAVLVNINPLYTPHEAHEQLRDSGARVLVVIDLFADAAARARTGTAVETLLIAGVDERFPAAKRALVRTSLHLRRQLPPAPPDAVAFATALSRGRRRPTSALPSVTADDLALLQYTGGTTGVPKAAELRHRHLLANIAQIEALARPVVEPGRETVLTALPLYHIFAFTFNLLLFHHLGARNVLCPSPRPVSRLRKAFERFPPSIASGVNLLFHGLLQEAWFRRHPPRSLRLAIAGGTALHRSTAERWEATVGHPILEGYGLTESSPVLAVNPPSGSNRLGSVGVPVPGSDVRILDDRGQTVPPGTAGEICARGPQVFERYRGRDEESRHALRDGWLHTGDIGFMDTDGYLYVVDRKKDMIDVAGFNVFPNEVEECLTAHPSVAEVAVVGAPRGEGGEGVVAFVVPGERDLDEESLRAFARERLTGYKIPRRIVFRDELPKSPVGKLLRRELRAEAREALEEEEEA